jgi:heme exporter protein D
MNDANSTFSTYIANLNIESFTQYIWVGVFIIAIAILIYLIQKTNTDNKTIDKEIQQEEEFIQKINITEGELILNFLDRFILEKYNYHKYLTLLPIYLDKKIPEKNIVQDVKEKIYVSVVGSLTKPVKSKILTFFTEKGIEIYIHEKIVILMNETDFASTGKYTEAFRDINLTNVDKILK